MKTAIAAAKRSIPVQHRMQTRPCPMRNFSALEQLRFPNRLFAERIAHLDAEK
jgi:hypothetical protein